MLCCAVLAGHAWLANTHGFAIQWESIGCKLGMSIGDPFQAALPEEMRSDTAAATLPLCSYAEQSRGGSADVAGAARAGEPQHGDRGTQLMLLGLHMDTQAVLQALRGATLTDEEMARRPALGHVTDPRQAAPGHTVSVG